jgi:hypothetical protein
MSTPLAAARRIKDNRFFQNRIEIGPPTVPALPGSAAAAKSPVKTEEQLLFEQQAEIMGFLHEEGKVADGVRRVLLSIRSKRRELTTEWDVRAAVANFVQKYQEAVPGADPEYVRGMKLALKVYLGSKEVLA